MYAHILRWACGCHIRTRDLSHSSHTHTHTHTLYPFLSPCYSLSLSVSLSLSRLNQRRRLKSVWFSNGGTEFGGLSGSVWREFVRALRFFPRLSLCSYGSVVCSLRLWCVLFPLLPPLLRYYHILLSSTSFSDSRLPVLPRPFFFLWCTRRCPTATEPSWLPYFILSVFIPFSFHFQLLLFYLFNFFFRIFQENFYCSDTVEFEPRITRPHAFVIFIFFVCPVHLLRDVRYSIICYVISISMIISLIRLSWSPNKFCCGMCRHDLNEIQRSVYPKSI